MCYQQMDGSVCEWSMRERERERKATETDLALLAARCDSIGETVE